jgi:hypothetical protein
MNRKLKTLALPIGAAVVLGTSGFAYMASNGVAQSFAGEGNGDIAGYNVSNVQYKTDPDENYITRVSFDLDHAANPDNVKAVINQPGAGTGNTTRVYDDCTNPSGWHFVCDPHVAGDYANILLAQDVDVTAAS